LFIKARDLNENGEQLNADTVLIQALEIDPDFALAHLYLHLGAGITKAKSLAHKVKPGESLLIRAKEAYYSGNLNVAIILVDSLLELYPRDKHCLNFASGVYFEVDEDKAINMLYKALDQDPYYAAAYKFLGYRFLDMSKFSEAEDAFEHYFDLLPESGNTAASFADYFYRNEHDIEALAQYKKVLHLDPTLTYFNERIVWINILLGDFEEARRVCNKWYESGTKELEEQWSKCMLAGTYFIQGTINACLEVMDSYIKLADEENKTLSLIIAMHFKGSNCLLAFL